MLKTIILIYVLLWSFTVRAAVSQPLQVVCQSEDSALDVSNQDPDDTLRLPGDCGVMPRGLIYEVLGSHIGAFYNASYITFIGGERNGTQAWIFERR